MEKFACPHCGKETEYKEGAKSAFCKHCGKKYDIVICENDVKQEAPKSKKLVPIIAVVLAVVLIIGAVCIGVFANKNKNESKKEPNEIETTAENIDFFEGLFNREETTVNISDILTTAPGTTIAVPGITNATTLPGVTAANKPTSPAKPKPGSPTKPAQKPTKPVNKPSDGLSLTIAEANRRIGIVASGWSKAAGLKKDGTVIQAGSPYDNISGWNNIKAISIMSDDIVGLRKDGTVIITESLDVSGFKSIVSITSGWDYVIGAKSDGTVVCAGSVSSDNKNIITSWRNIATVSANSKNHNEAVVALRKDGTVVSVGYGSKQNVASGWRNIVAVSAGRDFFVGLKKDGTVVSTGLSSSTQAEISKWKNIVAVAADDCCTVYGLKKDGTVVGVGSHIISSEKEKISELKNVVAIVSGEDRLIAVKNDGTAIGIGSNSGMACTEIKEWYGLKTP